MAFQADQLYFYKVLDLIVSYEIMFNAQSIIVLKP